MRWLLWKDYRHNRLIVVAALFFLLAPHLFWMALYGACTREFLDEAGWDWPKVFGVASVYSLLLCQAGVALIGGNAIAGERVDRSAEFLFSLPIARGRLLASKVLLALFVAAAPWLVNVPTLWCVGWTLPRDMRPTDFGPLLANTAIAGLTAFCAAWLLSSLFASPAYCAIGGLVTPLLVLFGIGFVDTLFYLRTSDAAIEHWWRGICLTLSPACFSVGTWLYLRRVEP